LLLATSVRSAQRDVDLIILDCRCLKLAQWHQRALQRRNRRAFGDEFEKTHDGVQHIAAAVLPKIMIVSPSSGPALGTSSVDALWARFYRRTLAPHGGSNFFRQRRRAGRSVVAPAATRSLSGSSTD
jgi:hypothetical protein